MTQTSDAREGESKKERRRRHRVEKELQNSREAACVLSELVIWCSFLGEYVTVSMRTDVDLSISEGNGCCYSTEVSLAVRCKCLRTHKIDPKSVQRRDWDTDKYWADYAKRLEGGK